MTSRWKGVRRYDRVDMARGWESKAVESQQEDAVRATADEKVVTPEELEKRARRGTLRLARARAVADLARAKTPAHRAMLEQMLSAIDQQLSES